MTKNIEDLAEASKLVYAGRLIEYLSNWNSKLSDSRMLNPIESCKKELEKRRVVINIREYVPLLYKHRLHIAANGLIDCYNNLAETIGEPKLDLHVSPVKTTATLAPDEKRYLREPKQNIPLGQASPL